MTLWVAFATAPTSARLRAQEAAPNPVAEPPKLSLAEAQRRALERNWDLLAARSGVDQAQAQRIIAREFANPVLSVGTSKISADGKGNATSMGNGAWDRSYDTVVAVSQLFETGGKRARRRESSAAGIRGAEARMAEARRTLDLGVTQAYLDVLLAQTNAAILSESAAFLRREALIAEARLAAGDIARTDKAQIEIAAEKLELDAATATNGLATSKIALQVLLGDPNPRGNWIPADDLTSLAGEQGGGGAEIPSEGDARTGGLRARPDIRAAQADLEKAEADLKLQKALRVPDLTVSVQYEHEPPDLPDTLGLSVSVPLPIWNRNKGAIRAAESARDQASLALGKAQAQAEADVAVAAIDYRTFADRLKRQRTEIEPKSTGIRNAVSLAYEKGGASLLELLSVQRGDNEVRLAAAESAADAARALAELRAALNRSTMQTNQR